jgi:hypothetical protein
MAEKPIPLFEVMAGGLLRQVDPATRKQRPVKRIVGLTIDVLLTPEELAQAAADEKAYKARKEEAERMRKINEASVAQAKKLRAQAENKLKKLGLTPEELQAVFGSEKSE